MTDISIANSIFSPEAFFVAVVRSQAIATMEKETQKKLRSYLFNSDEEVQRKIFTILQKEEEVNRQYDEEKLAFAKQLQAEFAGKSIIEKKKFTRTMRQQVEKDDHTQELNQTEQLISTL